MWKSKRDYTKADWRLYYATYEDASRRRSERGECGSHISNHYEAMRMVNRVNPARSDHGFDD
jgi:hypothetical protein